MNNQIFLLYGLIFFITCTGAQFPKERVCSSSRHIEDCNQLQRGNSEVTCVYAQDAVECAQRIRNGTADFGAFTAENAYHLASMGWQDLTVIKEVRHNERLREPFDYQSVVVVRSNHVGGVDGLRGVDFCHPGLHYERHQRWSEKFLKHFERSVIRTNCSFNGTSPVEVEVNAMSNFFNAACRPGSWSNNAQEDKTLKEKYSKLCALCDDSETCSYDDSSSVTSHRQALECVKKSGNAITYVALQEAQLFFNENSNIANEFSFLCPNGSLQSITSNVNPCVWLSQPWKLIITSTDKAIGLSTNINRWLNMPGFGWESSLKQILASDTSTVVAVRNIVRLPDFVSPIRPIPIGIDVCSNGIKWCTHSFEEKEKCDVLRMAALTTGIQPNIICNDAKSEVISCISDVSTGKADFVGIDSNFGYLARHPYNLTTALYEETEDIKYSSVVAIINEKDAERITKFEDFKDKRACFGEFGGIASIAFVNVAKNRGIFKREDCEFGPLLGQYFGESCFPGSRSVFHDPKGTSPDSLCSLCQTQAVPSTTAQPLRPMADQINEDVDRKTSDGIEGDDDDNSQNVPFMPNRSINCAAAPTNRYYGTRGALSCLNEMGEIAVIEHQNLVEHARVLKLNPNDFRILCRNGSLAANTGFDVDSNCFLTTIIDGEIVIRRNSDKNLGIINALLSLDRYLQSDPDFKMYNIFQGERNLLFEDSSVGLVSTNDAALSESVKNYIQLFQDVENCIEETDGAKAVAINFLLTFSLVLFTVLIRL